MVILLFSLPLQGTQDDIYLCIKKINDGGDGDSIVLSFPARHTGWYIIMYKINDGGDDDFIGIVLSFPARHTGWYIIIYKINNGGDGDSIVLSFLCKTHRMIYNYV